MSSRAEAHLECGVSLTDLTQQVHDDKAPADAAHQAQCPYCQEALRRLRATSAQLRQLAGEEVRAPHGLRDRVVRQLRRDSDRVIVADGPNGRDSVSDVLLAQLARHAAALVSGVRMASVIAAVGRDGGVALDVHLTTDLGPPLPEVIARVRDDVAASVSKRAGAVVTRVDVTVDDVV